MTLAEIEVLEVVRDELGITDESYDMRINQHITLLTQRIMNHINRQEMPDTLTPVLIDLIVNHMRINSDELKGEQSTKFGDTSVTYNTAPLPQDILRQVANELNNERRLTW